MKKILLALSLMMPVVVTAECNQCGDWLLERSDGSYAALHVRQRGADLVANMYISSGGDAPNQWEDDLTLKRNEDAFFYRDESTDCHLIFRFKKNRLVVQSLQQKSFYCGFAVGVSADGEYKKSKRVRSKNSR